MELTLPPVIYYAFAVVIVIVAVVFTAVYFYYCYSYCNSYCCVFLLLPQLPLFMLLYISAIVIAAFYSQSCFYLVTVVSIYFYDLLELYWSKIDNKGLGSRLKDREKNEQAFSWEAERQKGKSWRMITYYRIPLEKFRRRKII